MKRALLLFALLCAPSLVRAQAVDSLAPDVKVREIADGVWLHTTVSDSASGRIPANGLIVRGGAQCVVIDPGWNSRQAALLMEWADRVLSLPIRLAIATHAHEDRSGGLEAIHENNVRVLVLDSTLARLPEAIRTREIETFHGAHTLTVGDRTIELYAPGPGHTPDNIVVWLPDAQLLFGGCFVKSADATTLGNLADANVKRWPASMQNVVARYGGAKLVVPGHGEVGGAELLKHTLALLKQRR